MNIIKKTLITLFIASFLMAANGIAYAEESADKAVEKSVDSAVKNISDTLTHLNQGLDVAAKSDFSAATLHLKAARHSSGEIRGHELAVQKGVSHINNAMKEVKLGHPEQAVAEINLAIELYKAM
jgi:ribosomal protein S5